MYSHSEYLELLHFILPQHPLLFTTLPLSLSPLHASLPLTGTGGTYSAVGFSYGARGDHGSVSSSSDDDDDDDDGSDVEEGEPSIDPTAGVARKGWTYAGWVLQGDVCSLCPSAPSYEPLLTLSPYPPQRTKTNAWTLSRLTDLGSRTSVTACTELSSRKGRGKRR